VYVQLVVFLHVHYFAFINPEFHLPSSHSVTQNCKIFCTALQPALGLVFP